MTLPEGEGEKREIQKKKTVIKGDGKDLQRVVKLLCAVKGRGVIPFDKLHHRDTGNHACFKCFSIYVWVKEGNRSVEGN